MRKIAIVGIGIASRPSRAGRASPRRNTEVNDAQWTGRRQPNTAVVAQVLLDRARIPGEIDGKMGEKTRKAVRAFRALHALSPE
jgi:peptidoglycan hydrolase-like protein with peptidoglycan-binding domain